MGHSTSTGKMSPVSLLQYLISVKHVLKNPYTHKEEERCIVKHAEKR